MAQQPKHLVVSPALHALLVRKANQKHMHLQVLVESILCEYLNKCHEEETRAVLSRVQTVLEADEPLTTNILAAHLEGAEEYLKKKGG